MDEGEAADRLIELYRLYRDRPDLGRDAFVSEAREESILDTLLWDYPIGDSERYALLGMVWHIMEKANDQR